LEWAHLSLTDCSSGEDIAEGQVTLRHVCMNPLVPLEELEPVQSDFDMRWVSLQSLFWRIDGDPCPASTASILDQLGARIRYVGERDPHGGHRHGATQGKLSSSPVFLW